MIIKSLFIYNFYNKIRKKIYYIIQKCLYIKITKKLKKTILRNSTIINRNLNVRNI